MNNRKVALSMLSLSLLLTVAAGVPRANATTINFTAVQNTGQTFNSLAVDPATGYFYEYQSYGPSGYETLSQYKSISALTANTPSSTISIAQPFYGTYITANNGILYGRAGSGTQVAQWSLATGAQLSVNGGDPSMGSGTFNWGGDSGVNLMQDSTGMYVLGTSASTPGDWVLEKLNAGGLTAASNTQFNPGNGGTLGYGFIIDGTLYTGSSFSNNVITQAVNASTGVVSTVSDTLALPGSSYYFSDFTYNPVTDTLYAFNSETNTLYAAQNASAQFSGTASSASTSVVPGPGVAGLLLLAISAVALAGRKRRAFAAA